MNPRPMTKTVEFWVGLLASLFVAVQIKFWPDNPFPKTEFIAIMSWVVTRIAQKVIGPTDTNGKRAWKTIGFWAALVFAVVKYAFPSIPDETLTFVEALVLGDTSILLTKDVDFIALMQKRAGGLPPAPKPPQGE